MSDPRSNVKSTKQCSKISDVTVSSLHSGALNNMINSKSEKEDLKDEVIYDSGIVSEYSLSSEVLSGIDIPDIDVAEKNDGKSINVNQEAPSNSKKITREDSSSSEKEEFMRLDSGIDVDVSDVLKCSKEDSTNSTKKQTPVEESISIRYERSQVSIQALDEKYVWERFFAQDDDGDTRLHIAIIQENDDYVEQIIYNIPDSHYLDIQNYYYQTCLHLSVLLNKPKLTRLLLLAGAKTGLEDRNGNTALHLACLANNLACVKQLLDPLTAYERKYTIFKYTPTIDSPSEYLNEYNYDGLSCIHIAAKHADLKILRQLFIFGADVNIRECKGGYTILHEGVKTGNYSLVNYILQHSGIDIEKRNYAKLTPYQLSTYHPNIGKILLEKGAVRLMQLEDESDENYSSDGSEDDYYEEHPAECPKANEVSNMISNLSTKESDVVAT